MTGSAISILHRAGNRPANVAPFSNSLRVITHSRTKKHSVIVRSSTLAKREEGWRTLRRLPGNPAPFYESFSKVQERRFLKRARVSANVKRWTFFATYPPLSNSRGKA